MSSPKTGPSLSSFMIGASNLMSGVSNATVAPAPADGDPVWQFAEMKGAGDEEATEADIISCVEFNDDGSLLATGDKGGRVVVFQHNPSKQRHPNKQKGFFPKPSKKIPAGGHVEYEVYGTFQSHEPEFDYLKSIEIEEKINKIRWLRPVGYSNFMLTTNDKTIKMWKLTERAYVTEGWNIKNPSSEVIPSHMEGAPLLNLRVPKNVPVGRQVDCSIKRVFGGGHQWHINSVSVNSDQEMFLSADDLRINIWSTERSNESFNIVDIKPPNLEDLTEVITAAEFHPTQCNLFLYSSSKGTIRLCDMRQRALCDSHVKLYEEPDDPRNFFSEIISGVADIKFCKDGRYFATRDYLTVKVWDLHNESRPVETYQVHDYLRSRLCDLYENDCLFDKFECAWSPDSKHLMSGSYNNLFKIFSRDSGVDSTYEASRQFSIPNQAMKQRKICAAAATRRKRDELSVDSIDYQKKILHSSWHPHADIIAVAATHNLYIYSSKETSNNAMSQ